MKSKIFAAALAISLLVLLTFAGCGKSPEPETLPPETTEETAPPATVPADGNPGDVTCKGTYTADPQEVQSAADSVVATVGDARLTNRELQLYYWLEVSQYRQSGAEPQPDYTQSLDTQTCPADSSVNSWQQYFLRNALNAWSARQALVLQARNEGVPTEEAYNPKPEEHEKYMTDMPATKYLYGYNDSFLPNEMHQAYLDEIPAQLQTLAAELNFADSNALAQAMSGGIADASALEAYVNLLNSAYMYYVELGYAIEPAAEEIDALAAASASAGETFVDLRHILLIPEGAEVAEDGTVQCSEEAWSASYADAEKLLKKWNTTVGKRKPTEFTFGEFANKNSADAGSALNGGLYVNLRKGQLIEELDAWCFDPARQVGDTDIIRTACGWHIVYCAGIATDSQVAAEESLVFQGRQQIVEAAMELYPAEIHYDTIALAEAEGADLTDSDLLYPDVAHERYPTIPLFLQQDYPDTYYGNFKIRTHGCGITTLAMIASYFTDEEWTPPELCDLYGHYCTVRGTDISLFDNEPSALGFYLDRRCFSWREILGEIENGRVVVSLQYAGYWTRGGHFLAIQEMNEEGLLVVRDSNMFNYARLHGHKVDAFNPSLIPNNGAFYWIYQDKVTRIPACVRCGEEGTESAPQILLREDYHCAKCITSMSRRDSFLMSLAG